MDAPQHSKVALHMKNGKTWSEFPLGFEILTSMTNIYGESLTHRAKQYHVFLMFFKNYKLRGINIYLLGTFFIFYKVNEKGFESPTFLRICFLNILSFTSSSLLYLVSYVFYPQRKTRKNVLNWISERNVGNDCAESF